MKIKKFKAKNFSEALKLVKKEFSEDAVILSSEEKKGFRPFVEITAAVDYDSGISSQTVSSDAGFIESDVANEQMKFNGQQFDKLSSFSSHHSINTSLPQIPVPAIDEVKSEIEKLRESIEGMRDDGYRISLPPAKKALLNFLRARSIREDFALCLCNKVEGVNEIPAHISESIKVKEDYMNKKTVMLVGPTGVGKTTTIAKLAANAIKKGMKTAIISLDTYRIGATEQIRIYSKIMGIPLSIVSNIAQLKDSLSRFEPNSDVIFIDTTGKNPKDIEYIDNIADICHAFCEGHNNQSDAQGTKLPLEMHLLISANSNDEFMISAYNYYKKLPIDYVAFTKTDESVRLGSLYNMMLIYQKPVAYITTGQKVPEDIEFVTVDRLTNLILN